MNAVGKQELDSLTGQLGDMLQLAHVAMSHAIAALLTETPSAADSVMAADRALHAMRHEVEDHAAGILATRDRLAATDLPTILASVHINADLERMADLARLVTDIARTQPSRHPIPPQPLAILRQMSQVCLDLAAQARDIVESRTTEPDGGSDKIYRLEQLYEQLLSASASVQVGTALDVTLAGRFCARYADHAASAARHAELLTVDTADK